MGSTTVFTVGSFVAVVLQTLGLYTLSEIIVSFYAFFKAASFLLMVFAMMAALLQFVMYGRVSMALYFLIGPALFYFMIGATVPVTQATFQFGERVETQGAKEVERVVTETIGKAQYDKKAEVPLFFVKYDALISSTVQGMVSFLIKEEVREDVIGAARERVLSRVLQGQTENKDFQGLLAISLMGSCARQTALQQELGGYRLASAKPGSKEEFEVNRKRAEYNRLKTEVIPLPPNVRGYVVDELKLTVPDNPTCDEIWEYARQGALKTAEQVLKITPEEQSKYNLTAAESTKLLEEVRQKLAPSGTPASDTVKGLEVLAAFILRNSMLRTHQAAFTAQMEGRQSWNLPMKERIFGNVTSYEAIGARAELIFFLSTIPYFQGLLLFGLTVAFPFFALMLIVPDRATAFITWMGLWAWVKSWDVGFAVVSIFRDILWRLLPNVGQYRTYDNFNAINWNDPASVMNLVYQSDPTMSMNIYYGLLGVLYMSVPYVTGQFVRGAGDMMSTITGRLQQVGNKVQTKVAAGQRMREAAFAQKRIGENMALAGANRMLKAQADSGKTADGISRDKFMDGTKPMHMRVQELRGQYDEAFSKQTTMERAYLGTLQNRPDSQTTGISENRKSEFINQEQEKYRGRPLGDVFSPKAAPGSGVNAGDVGTKGGGAVKPAYQDAVAGGPAGSGDN